MTLDELIKQLGDLRDKAGGDALLVLAKDSEGNGYSPLVEAGIAMYAAETTYSGECYPTVEDLLAEDSRYGEEDAAPDDAVKAVFLWPTN